MQERTGRKEGFSSKEEERKGKLERLSGEIKGKGKEKILLNMDQGYKVEGLFVEAFEGKDKNVIWTVQSNSAFTSYKTISISKMPEGERTETEDSTQSLGTIESTLNSTCRKPVIYTGQSYKRSKLGCSPSEIKHVTELDQVRPESSFSVNKIAEIADFDGGFKEHKGKEVFLKKSETGAVETSETASSCYFTLFGHTISESQSQIPITKESCSNVALSEASVVVVRATRAWSPVLDMEMFPTKEISVDTIDTKQTQYQVIEVVTGDPGDELFVDVDKFSFNNDLPTIRTPIESQALQSDGEDLQLDSYEHQSVTEKYIKAMKRKCPKTSSCSREILEQHFGMKLNDAAVILGVSRSTFKRWCRVNNIRRWPFPKRSKFGNSLSIAKQMNELPQGNVEPITEAGARDPSSSEPPKNLAPTHATTMSTVTIKATYASDTSKFNLSFSSSMAELMEKVTIMTKLHDGTFNIKYLDEEDEYILIACDEDLQDCMNSLRVFGKTTIRMLIEPITNESPQM